MLLNNEHVGQHVLMKYKRNGQIYTGLVVDGDPKYAVVKMDADAQLLIEDEFGEIDTRYDKDWIFIEVKKDVTMGDSGEYEH